MNLGTSSDRVLIISSSTLNSTLTIEKNPNPTPTSVNLDFPCQNRSESRASLAGSDPIVMPSANQQFVTQVAPNKF